jgi:hypothetical protein
VLLPVYRPAARVGEVRGTESTRITRGDLAEGSQHPSVTGPAVALGAHHRRTFSSRASNPVGSSLGGLRLRHSLSSVSVDPYGGFTEMAFSVRYASPHRKSVTPGAKSDGWALARRARRTRVATHGSKLERGEGRANLQVVGAPDGLRSRDLRLDRAVRTTGLLHRRSLCGCGACPQRDSNPCFRLERAAS